MDKVSIVPAPGRVLITVEIDEFDTVMLIAGSIPKDSRWSRIAIAALPDILPDEFKFLKVGQNVLVDLHELYNMDNKVVLEENERSFNALNKSVRGLTNSETTEFKKSNPTVKVIEYMLIYMSAIRAVVNES